MGAAFSSHPIVNNVLKTIFAEILKLLGMKRVIFLDFDGVLNTENYQRKLHQEGKPKWDSFGYLFDPEAVGNLKKVLDSVPDSLLVINSSWKLEGIERMISLWKARNLPGTINSITPDYAPDLLNIDLEELDNIMLLSGKGNEVKQWLSQNGAEGCPYVIFDDIPDFLPEQEAHLICTDPRVGITFEDAIKAINLLTFSA